MPVPDRYYVFECAKCGRERHLRRRGVRLVYPCDECGSVESHDRVGRVDAGRSDDPAVTSTHD